MLFTWLPCELLFSDSLFSVRVLVPLQVTDRPGVGTPEQAVVPSEPVSLSAFSVMGGFCFVSKQKKKKNF